MSSICHYTTAETAIKILNTGTLWASDAKFMDDPTEKSFFLNNLKHFLKIEEANNKIGFFGGFGMVLSNLKLYMLSFTKHMKQHHYENGNLTIGRYFGGRDWVGLVFNEERIQQNIISETQKFTSMFCSGNICYYSPEQLQRITSLQDFFKAIDDVLTIFFDKDNEEKNSYISYLENIFPSVEKEKVREKFKSCIIEFCSYNNKEQFVTYLESNKKEAMSILPLIMLVCFVTKHYGFEDENEKRFGIVVHEKKQNENVYKQMLQFDVKPHLEIPFELTSISSILIGPGHNQNRINNHINEVLQHKLGEHNIKIVNSTIPWESK